MAESSKRMDSYCSSNLEGRQRMFYDYILHTKKRAIKTAKAYSNTAPKNPDVVRIIERESSKESIYDVFSIPVVERIHEQVNDLAIDKKRNNALSAPFQMYKDFLEWLKEEDEEVEEAEVPEVPASSEDEPVDSSLGASPVSIQVIIDGIKKSGLLYSDDLIARFVISLMTKPFVILSGLAGSGKTQLALAFAKAMSETKEQYRVVPVGADWTNREPLLGYPNALEEGKYVLPETGVLQLLMKASDDPTHPYFLILDEMNLSYVERYFADFLSAMESHEMIPLWDKESKDAGERVTENKIKVSSKVELPQNLFIIGTINVDETTYMFSPKVLDRANVIEFKIDEEDMLLYLDKAVHVDVESVSGSLSSMAVNFVELSKNPVKTGFDDSKDVLLKFFNKLKSVNAEFGYRSASEIGRFIALSRSLKTLDDEKAVDAAIVQKLLPKLHGSRKKLCPVLSALWAFCMPETEVGIEKAVEVPVSTKYPLAADKILRMYRSATDNGFTSFAEA